MEGTVYDPIFTPKEMGILSRYVSGVESDIFVFKPALAGLVGAVFARYSRAAGGAKIQLLNEFLDENGELKLEKLDQLIGRVLILYGDDSVGELEYAQLALENISNIATKAVENLRLQSPIEQSSRYAVYDQKDRDGNYRYLRPPEVKEAGLLEEYERPMNFIFEKYIELMSIMGDFYRRLKPESEAEYAIKPNDPVKYKLSQLTEDKEIRAWNLTYKTDIKTKACDTVRGLLPAATLTNVGNVANGRTFQNMLTQLLSSDLAELRDIGDRAKDALSTVIPKYVERAGVSDYILKVRDDMRFLSDELIGTGIYGSSGSNPVTLFYAGSYSDFDAMAIAHILYPYTTAPLSILYRKAQRMDIQTRKRIAETYCGHKKDRGNRRNKPGRGLEFGYPIIFDLIGDYGIYRDLQRHRMLTQQRQLLGPHLGYNIPDDIKEAGFGNVFEECLEKSEDLYYLLQHHFDSEVAQYGVLFAFNVRWYVGMNHREAFHKLELRTGPQGHPSYRKICQEMHRQLLQNDSLFAPLMEFVDYEDYQWSRADSEARQRQKESKLSD